MFIEVFVKGFLWLLIFIIGACLAFVYFLILPMIFVEISLANADIATYILAIAFFVVLHFIFAIRLQDYNDKKEAEKSAAMMQKFLEQKWMKDGKINKETN